MLYCRQQLASLKYFLSYCHDLNLWDKPRCFDRLFKINKPRETLEEQTKRVTSEAPYLSIDELTRLYHAAITPLEQAIILLGLNCGFCGEAASLRRDEVKRDEGGQWYIERLRPKTRCYARWSLWDETAEALSDCIIESKAQGIAEALSYRGHPIGVGPCSSFYPLWKHLMKRSGVVKPQKLLRKTAARMAKEIGGIEASEMMLAHVEMGMNKFYAGRNWKRLATVIEGMREQLPFLQ
jgi:integrase